MPPRRLDQARPFVTLGLVVVIWIFLPTAVKTFTRATFFELTAPMTIGASYARDLKEFWALRLHSNAELIEAGRDLARLNSSYELAVQQNSALQAEIERLEGLLRLPTFAEYRYEHARVARREFSGWWQRLIIRKGRNFGIPVGAPVIFTGGVVGRVAEVGLTTAAVELISSPEFRVAGAIEGDSHTLSFQGGNNPTFAPPSGVVELVPLDIIASRSSPKRVITSGLGGVFPPGLTLGEITRLEVGPDALFQTGEVKLDERLGSLTEVTVLVPLHSD